MNPPTELIKACLRKNPDAIIIGEIQDIDVAKQTIITADIGPVHAIRTAEGQLTRRVEDNS